VGERFAFLPADLSGALPPLARAALSGTRALPGVRLPRSAAELEGPAPSWDERARGELSGALCDSLAPLEPHVAVLDAARSLARAGRGCVVTAAAPGLLGGPLASLWRALACVRLAKTAAEHLGVEVVPVLFNRADERTLAPAHLLNPRFDLQRVGLSSMGATARPLGAVVLDERRHRLGALRAALAQLHGGAPHLADALDLLAPRPGESPARAFTRALLALAGPLGLVVVEPEWIRPQLCAALVRVLGSAPPGGLAAGARAVAELDPSLAVDDLPVLAHLGPQGGRDLYAGGEGFRFAGEPGSRNAAELAAALVGDPGDWSAGPRTEHLALDLALPSVCELGGPRELAARAAAAPLREAAGLAPGSFVLRGGVSVVDTACARSLAACSLQVEDVLAGQARGGEPADPPPVALERLRGIAEEAGSSLRALRPDLARIDRGLAARLRRAAAQVEGLVGGIAERAERVHRNRGGSRGRHLRRVEGTLRPGGGLQEERLGPFSLVARHGRGCLEPVADALDSFGAEHLVVHLGAVRERE
jgi:hypothetical protein